MVENKSFNARVEEDEMIVDIAEYEEMKKQIENLKLSEKEQFRIRQNLRNENLELETQNSKLKQENQRLKQGIINFIKTLGV